MVPKCYASLWIGVVLSFLLLQLISGEGPPIFAEVNLTASIPEEQPPPPSIVESSSLSRGETPAVITDLFQDLRGQELQLDGGSDDCPCIERDSSGNMKSNETGEVLVINPGLCYPPTYGSSFCDAHDRKVDPQCLAGGDIPEYCHDRWCYIDFTKCKQSTKAFYRSDYYSNLYYSYETCNYTNENWNAFQTTGALKDKYITVTLPSWIPLSHYKLNRNGTDVAEPGGPDYYDDSIPWRGWMIDYLNTVAKVSEIAGFRYTYRTRHADVVHADSTWTAAIYDVQAGLTDMSASIFWMTPDRLQMTPFTIHITTDKLYLWVKQPVLPKGFFANARRVAQPFTWELWVVLCSACILVGALSVLFANEHGVRRKWWRKMHDDDWKYSTPGERFWILLRIFIDSVLQQFTFFFGHTVEYDMYSNMAQKVLMVGFGFLILIAVAAYTANLAAFLTLSSVGDYVSTIEEAIDKKVTICALGVLRQDFAEKYAGYDYFVYTNTSAGGNPDLELFNQYDLGHCQAIVVTERSVQMNPMVQEAVCPRKLVNTKSLVIEKHVAFPANKDVVGGLSYFMMQAAQLGITSDKFEKVKRPSPICSWELDTGDQQENDYLALTPGNFALPLVVFMVCAILSLLIHFWSRRTRIINKRKTRDRMRSERSKMSQMNPELLRPALSKPETNTSGLDFTESLTDRTALMGSSCLLDVVAEGEEEEKIDDEENFDDDDIDVYPEDDVLLKVEKEEDDVLLKVEKEDGLDHTAKTHRDEGSVLDSSSHHTDIRRQSLRLGDWLREEDDVLLIVEEGDGLDHTAKTHCNEGSGLDSSSHHTDRRQSLRLSDWLRSLQPFAGHMPSSDRRLSDLEKQSSYLLGPRRSRYSKRRRNPRRRSTATLRPSFDQGPSSIQELVPTLVDNEASGTIESKIETLQLLQQYQTHVMNQMKELEKKKR